MEEFQHCGLKLSNDLENVPYETLEGLLMGENINVVAGVSAQERSTLLFIHTLKPDE